MRENIKFFDNFNGGKVGLVVSQLVKYSINQFIFKNYLVWLVSLSNTQLTNLFLKLVSCVFDHLADQPIQPTYLVNFISSLLYNKK